MKPETVERLTLLNTGLLVVLVWKVFVASDSPTDINTQSAEEFAQLKPHLWKKPVRNSLQIFLPIVVVRTIMKSCCCRALNLWNVPMRSMENIDLPTDEQLQAAIKTIH